MNRVVRLASIAVALVVLPVAALLVLTWGTGRQLQVVESGSMEPTYPVGTALVVAPASPSAVEVGEVVVFADPDAGGRLVTHRVIAVDEGPDGLSFTTRGDANPADDPGSVPATAIRGVVERGVPGLGRLLGALDGPTAPLVLVGLPLLLLVGDLALGRSARAGSRPPPMEAV